MCIDPRQEMVETLVHEGSHHATAYTDDVDFEGGKARWEARAVDGSGIPFPTTWDVFLYPVNNGSFSNINLL